SLDTRPSSPPFPYTTLFRSPGEPGNRFRRGRGSCRGHGGAVPAGPAAFVEDNGQQRRQDLSLRIQLFGVLGIPRGLDEGGSDLRSEEHTSELQSRENLVCRL